MGSRRRPRGVHYRARSDPGHRALRPCGCRAFEGATGPATGVPEVVFRSADRHPRWSFPVGDHNAWRCDDRPRWRDCHRSDPAFRPGNVADIGGAPGAAGIPAGNEGRVVAGDSIHIGLGCGWILASEQKSLLVRLAGAADNPGRWSWRDGRNSRFDVGTEQSRADFLR